MKRLILAGIVAIAMMSGIASPVLANPEPKPEPLLVGPAPTEIVDAYAPALACLNQALSPAQKDVVYGVPFFADQTGKTNIAAQDASGALLAQDYGGALDTALAKIGVRRVNISPVARNMFEWSVKFRNFTPEQAHQVALLLPDIMIQGGFDFLDINPGFSYGVNGSVTAQHRQHNMVIGFDAVATAMAFNKINAQPDEELTNFGYMKQVIGSENEFGLTSFFGGGNLIGFDIDHEKREPLQFGARQMMSVVAYRVVRDVTQVTSCDDMFRKTEMANGVQTLAHTR